MRVFTHEVSVSLFIDLINKVSILYVSEYLLLVLQLVPSRKGGLTLSGYFWQLSSLTIRNSFEPRVDCRYYLKTVGQWIGI